MIKRVKNWCLFGVFVEYVYTMLGLVVMKKRTESAAGEQDSISGDKLNGQVCP
jgi:hypothetical protein